MLRVDLRREAAIYRHCLVGLAEAQCASILISISRLIWKIVDGFAARQGSLVRIFLNLCKSGPEKICRLSWIVRISREPVATVRRFCGLPLPFGLHLLSPFGGFTFSNLSPLLCVLAKLLVLAEL